MISAVDLYELERKYGKEAAAVLTKSLRSMVAQTSGKKTGEALKSRVTPKYKNQRLDRLSIIAPHYIFKQHFGFEGRKKNGFNQRLRATNVLNKTINDTDILNKLIDNIASNRAEEVISKINF